MSGKIAEKVIPTTDFVKYYGFSVFKHNLKNTFLPISI